MFNNKVISEITDWSHIDYVCIKSKSGSLCTAVYYLDGHPMFEKTLSDSDLKYIGFVRSIGCYGTSEKILDGKSNTDQFYIRVNIKNGHQEEQLIDYMIKNRKISDNQREMIRYLSRIDKAVNCDNDYKPLYYCGFSKPMISSSYYGIRFYFKTFGADESIRYDAECIHYLEKYSQIQNDAAFKLVRDIILSYRAGLRCIGVEFPSTSNINVKVKYYLCEIPGGDSMEELLQTLRCYPKYTKAADMLLSISADLKDLHCDWIQVSSGYCNGDESINMYITQGKNKKKYYFLNEGLILRDIGGISFLIDIHEKHYYDLKKLFSVNETGQAIIEYLMNHGVCTLDGIVSYLRSMISNYEPGLYPVIYYDCKMFVEQLKEGGFLEEMI